MPLYNNGHPVGRLFGLIIDKHIDYFLVTAIAPVRFEVFLNAARCSVKVYEVRFKLCTDWFA